MGGVAERRDWAGSGGQRPSCRRVEGGKGHPKGTAVLPRSPAGQEARRLLVAWNTALTPPLWVQAGDSNPR